MMTMELPASRRHLVTGVLFATAVAEGFDLQLAGLVAGSIGAEFGLGPADLGVFFSTALFGTFFGSFMGGWLADKIGRRDALVMNLVLFAVACFATAFMTDFSMVLVWRFIAGLGFGGAMPCLIALTMGLGEEGGASRVSIVYGGTAAGGALMSLTAILGYTQDWRQAFIIGAALPMIMVVVILLTITRDLPQQAQVMAAPRKSAPAAPAPAPAPKARYRDLFGPRQIVLTALISLAIPVGLMVPNFFINWLPKLMASIGLSPAEAGYIQLANNTGAALGCIVAGFAVAQTNRLRRSAICFAVLAAAIMVFPSVTGSFKTTMLAALLIGGAVQCSQAILISLAPLCFPDALRGRGVGFALACGRIGAMMGPLLAGLLIAGGLAPLSLVYATLPAVLVAGILALNVIRLTAKR